MITIRYFAKLKDIAGRAQETLLVEAITIEELITVISSQYEGFSEYVSTCLVAVNEEYAQHEERLKSGDTVAFIPPVSGG